MKTKVETSQESNHDEIRELAFLLWEQAGCPAGKDREFWIKAEEQIVTANGLPSPSLKATTGKAKAAIKSADKPRKKSSVMPANTPVFAMAFCD